MDYVELDRLARLASLVAKHIEEKINLLGGAKKVEKNGMGQGMWWRRRKKRHQVVMIISGQTKIFYR